MADIKLRIEVNPNAESEFLGAITNNNARVSNTSINTDSINQFVDIPTTEFDGSNGIVWNTDFINENGEEDTYIVFNDNDELDNVENTYGYLESEVNPDEFFWGIIPESKEYSVKLTFTGAKNLKDIVVFGDKINNQFPTEAIVDGNTKIYSDDYKWAINLGSESDTHTIEFTKWNRSNYNACITLIRVMLRYFEVNKFNGLRSMESFSQSTSNPESPSYGAIANEGSLTVLDINGELYDMIRDDAIPISNLETKIIVNEKPIQTHTTIDSYYDVNSKVLSLELSNSIIDWDKLRYKGLVYQDKEESAYNILYDIMRNLKIEKNQDLTLGDFNAILSDNAFGNKTLYQYLQEIKIQYPVIEKNKTYRELIAGLCGLAQMDVYFDDNGNIVFKNSRPILLDKEHKPLINIPKSNRIKPLEVSIIKKNKYEGVEIREISVTDLYEYDKLLLTQTTSAPNNFTFSNSAFYSAFDSLYGVGGKIESFYTTGEFYFTMKQNNNLSQILKISAEYGTDSEGYSTIFLRDGQFPYVSQYKKQWGRVGLDDEFLKDINGDDYQDKDSVFATTVYYDSGNIEFEDYEKPEVIYTDKIPIKYEFSGFEKKLSVDDVSYIKIKVEGDICFVKYYLLSRMVVYDIQTNRYDSIRRALIYKYEAYAFDVSIYGHTRNITFNESSASSPNINEFNSIAFVNDNDFITDKTLINGVKISEQIKNNILQDYKDGISTATISIICGNYYNNNGLLVKDWTKGEVLQVGDIVYFEDDKYVDGTQRYWRVTGRNFRYSGVPMIDLELQEVKIID